MKDGRQVVVDDEEGVIGEPAEREYDHHNNHHFNDLNSIQAGIVGWTICKGATCQECARVDQ